MIFPEPWKFVIIEWIGHRRRFKASEIRFSLTVSFYLSVFFLFWLQQGPTNVLSSRRSSNDSTVIRSQASRQNIKHKVSCPFHFNYSSLTCVGVVNLRLLQMIIISVAALNHATDFASSFFTHNIYLFSFSYKSIIIHGTLRKTIISPLKLLATLNANVYI